MSRLLRTFFSAAVAATLVMIPAAMRDASAGDTGRYVGGGTAAARANGQPVADEGGVVCDNGDGIGAGGVCLAFGDGNSVSVIDDLAGDDIAYQVCIDNSGDGVCTSPDTSAHCPDQVAFSHDDAGAFFNPVGPLPTGFLAGCSGGPWKGYVVMLCEGAHAVGADTHAHEATSGTATVVFGGEGLGTFCGGTQPAPSRKPYTVGSGARYLSGGTAVVRADGEPAADEGAVVCNNGDNVGVGGFCTSFGGGNAMAVFDQVSGTDVAFQVCIDNDGDGLCTSPDSGHCADYVAFSHDDGGAFYNPVGPLPTGFSTGCGDGAWDGYVVFLCEGTHVSGLAPHAHPATTGTGRVTTGGEGTGTFCGGSYEQPSSKRYRLDLNDDGTRRKQPCRAVAASPADSEDTFTGTLDGGPVSATDFGRPPTTGLTLTCNFSVNGSLVASVSGSGQGFASAGPTPLSFVAPEASETSLCATVTFDDGSSAGTECTSSTLVSSPPDAVGDAVDQLGATVRDLTANFTDPLACPLLAQLAGTYGPVTVTVEGDVYVDGRLVLDCPPYDVAPPPLSDATPGGTVLLNGLPL